MSKVRLALYKGQGTWANALIRWWTGSQYSHCELVIGGVAHSSSVRDGGVRAKVIEFDADHWDLIDLPWAESSRVLEHFSRTNGKPYGWLDLLKSQVFRRPSSDDRGDFCNEWCAAALGIPNPRDYSPGSFGDLCRWLSAAEA